MRLQPTESTRGAWTTKRRWDPLAEIGNIVQPSPDRNLGYPLMYSFVVATADAPYLGYLLVTGQLRGLSATYPFGLADPVRALQVLTWIAHLGFCWHGRRYRHRCI